MRDDMTWPALDRRGLLVAAGAMTLSGAMPAAALAAQRPPERWDLTDLFADAAAWDAERAALEAALPTLAPAPIDTAPALKAALDRRYATMLRAWRWILYAVLKSDEDIRVAENAERRGVAMALQGRLDAAMSWFPGAVIALGQDRVTALVASDPGLAPYRYPLATILRRAPHTLDTRGEALLAAAGPTLGAAQTIRQTLISSDIVFPEVPIAGKPVRIDLEGYGRVMQTAPRPDRARAYDAFARTLRGYERTFGQVLGAKVSGNIFTARARGYSSALDASLDATAIPRGVYDALLTSVKAALPLHQRYLGLKRRLLGVERLAIWDVPAPAVSLDRTWDVAEARALTLAAVAPLGRDYARQLAENTLKPWADSQARPGKREGGYVAGAAYSHPFVLLNHTGDFASLSTYAHEWGHAMHSWYARKQPYPLYDFPTFIAEVPSKTQELLLLDHMIATAKTPAEKIFFLDRLCEQYRGTLYVQSLFADFELAVYQAAEGGNPMSGPQMSARYAQLFRDYYGDTVELHPDSGALWSTVIHFYLNFYVFQYATCLTAATAFAEAIRRDGPKARDRYLALLSAGGSDDAYRLIRDAGVDLATPQPYQRAIARFERAVGDLEKAASGYAAG